MSLKVKLNYKSRDLIHWDWVTHICVSKLEVIIISYNGLWPICQQAIIWTKDNLLSNESLATNFSEFWIKIKMILFNKNSLQNVLCKMAGNLSQLICVNTTITPECWLLRNNAKFCASVHEAVRRLTDKSYEDWSHEIECYNDHITLKSDMHLSSTGDKVPVKFQNYWKSLNLILAVLRHHEILQ